MTSDDVGRLQEEIKRLERKLARHERLLHETGAAVVRDSAELVRVLAELERSEATLKAQLHQALRFQRALHPPTLDDPRVRIEALSLPAEIISGDLYDFAAVDRDVIRVFVADATGHGVAAGLATMFIKSTYEPQKLAARTPAQVLRAMNDQLTSIYGNLELRFTAVCLDIDLAQQRLRYSTAAHPGPLLCRGEQIQRLPSHGTFVGMLSGVEFAEEEAAFADGDELVVFTDGLTDAEAADGTLFGEERTTTTIEAARRAGSSPAASLVQALSKFVGEGRHLADDVTIVAVRFSDRR